MNVRRRTSYMFTDEYDMYEFDLGNISTTRRWPT